MLYYDRTNILKVLVLVRQVRLKMYYLWYFLDKGFTFPTTVSNDCRVVLIISIGIKVASANS